MSSLSATQADGYYVPPAYLESGKFKKQSLNQFAGSKGHNQYLQRSVVRFELPHDGFCMGCKTHVGKGTRFNAHKAHVDDYFTTKIWEFTMKCRACANTTFKIRTDPKERGFAYISGIKKKVEEFDTVAAGTAGIIDTDLGNGIIEGNETVDAAVGHASKALAKLEKSVMGEREAMSERDQMATLLKLNEGSMWDDAASNASLRATYRSVRKAKKRRFCAAAAAGLGKGIEISDPLENDASKARCAFRDGKSSSDKRARSREKDSFFQLRSQSIFGKNSQSKGRLGLHHTFSSPNGETLSKVESGFNAPRRSKTNTERPVREIEVGGSEEKNEKKCTVDMAHSSAFDALADYGSDSD